MESNLHLPLDHGSWVEYRNLKAAVGAPVATYAMIQLFVDLGYQAQSGRPLGVMDGRAAKLTSETLEAIWPKEDGVKGPIEELKASGLLAGRSVQSSPYSGDGEDLVCDRFVKLNKHLDVGFKPMHLRGSERSALVRGLKSFGKEQIQLSLTIPKDVWLKEDGSSMTHEDISDVMMLIRGCDNVLGLKERPANGIGFTVELARAAYAVLKEFTADEIKGILIKLLDVRGTPSVPPTTEQLLAPGLSGKSRFSELGRMAAGTRK